MLTRSSLAKRFFAALVMLLAVCAPALAQPPLVTKHLSDFATPDGGGFPNDLINDHRPCSMPRPSSRPAEDMAR
ncbi:MAG: hypothetical protein H6591_10745 [Flavobacteriales bacterium]|nr:hypothetical protein [Flavobacteriales bacterium]